MNFVCTVDQIRRAENPLIQRQKETDGFMREAARAVAEVVKVTLRCLKQPRVLVLAGAGGNGGDGLYAGSYLANEGMDVTAVLLGKDGRVHEPALEAFRASGGSVLNADEKNDAGYEFDLVIDAVLGIGARGGLDASTAHFAKSLSDILTLSVDVPSGIDADTGATPAAYGNGTPAFITADITVTFGCLRRAHAISPFCGEIYVAPVAAATIVDGKETTESIDEACAALALETYTTWEQPESAHDWRIHTLLGVQRDPERAKLLAEKGLRGIKLSHTRDMEPAVTDTKYSGVVGVIAGSDKYPGAGILATTAAVRSTSAMVRYVGKAYRTIVERLPEVVATETLTDAGRVQAWVYGPGSDPRDSDTMKKLLKATQPCLLDADAITQLAESPELIDELRERSSRRSYTLLTPHDGEFVRLAGALNAKKEATVRDLNSDRLGAVCDMVDALGCAVLLKGRKTLIVGNGDIHSIDAGHSWLATPGSGDVLAGIIGAWIAHFATFIEDHTRAGTARFDWSAYMVLTAGAAVAAAVHATAGWLAAQTPYGPAPASASSIADAIPAATAKLHA